jgi:hypothetical protein
MKHFVRVSTNVPFRRFRGDVRREFMQRLLLLFMELWVPTSATFFRRAVLTLWHAFLFLGLRVFPLFFFLLGGLQPSAAFSYNFNLSLCYVR